MAGRSHRNFHFLKIYELRVFFLVEQTFVNDDYDVFNIGRGPGDRPGPKG